MKIPSKSFAVTLTSVTAIALLASSVRAYALWSARLDATATVDHGFATVSVTLSDSTGTLDTADGDDTELAGFGFTKTDAAEMEEAFRASGAAATPTITKQVTLSASGLRGNQGLVFSVAPVPLAQPQSWAGNSQITIWQAPGTECNIADAPGNPVPTSVAPAVLVAADYLNTAGVGKSASITLCLQAVFQGPKSYQNTATLTVAENSKHRSNSSWKSVVIPAAANDADLMIPITITPTTGGNT